MKKLILKESELIRLIESIILEMSKDTPHFINTILDKISEGGYESLTSIEKEILNSFSKDSLDVKNIMTLLNKKITSSGPKSLSRIEQDFFEDNSKIKNDEKTLSTHKDSWKFDDPKGEIPSMKFNLDSTYEEDGNLVHYGRLLVGGSVFFGNIYCDPYGNYEVCNFSNDDEVNLFEEFEGLEHEIEVFLEIICNDLKENLSGAL